MARYIDADSLYSRVKTHTNPYGKPTLDYKSGVKVLEMINQEPTADVVPKSEVEELREINSLLAAAGLAWQKHYENLAREIFEEIEKKVKASITVHLEELNKEHIQDTPLYDRHSGIIFALRVMDDFIAEIRKKYTEEKKDENQN